MILLLRGHIRNSFDNSDLYNLIKSIKANVEILEIYIQTWSIVQSSLSWRKLNENANPVTEDLIHLYFNDLSVDIKNILILDDEKIELIGNIEGNVCSSKAPLIGWKNMWYGMYKNIKYVNDISNDTENPYLLNIRFDVLNNFISMQYENILNMIARNKHANEVRFLTDYNFIGIDNAFVGDLKSMFILISHFYFNLDDIVKRYRSYANQEGLVFEENKKITTCLKRERCEVMDLSKFVYNFNENNVVIEPVNYAHIPHIKENNYNMNFDKRKRNNVLSIPINDKWAAFHNNIDLLFPKKG